MHDINLLVYYPSVSLFLSHFISVSYFFPHQAGGHYNNYAVVLNLFDPGQEEKGCSIKNVINLVVRLFTATDIIFRLFKLW